MDKEFRRNNFVYTDVLGFQAKSNFPNFVSLTKGDVEIMFIVPQEGARRLQRAKQHRRVFSKSDSDM
jgi:hypothetical protein